MIAIIIGFVSGIIGGMGIGGGAILIPAFIIFLNIDQHIIQSVNLIYFIPTAIIALIIHNKNKFINIKITFDIVIFGLLGSVIGAYLSLSMPSNILKKLFGIFLFFMGIYEFFRKHIIPNPSDKTDRRQW